MAIRSGAHDPRQAIKAGRALNKQTQAELARALTGLTKTAWSRRMVQALEDGHKQLTVEVLMTIARIHQLPYSFYLEGPERVKGLYRETADPRLNEALVLSDVA